MPKLGIEVTTGETAGSAGVSTSTGTYFVAQEADSGPSLTPTLCRSLNEYILHFGPRTATSSVLYDAVNSFFSLGGALCYVMRVPGETAKAASLSLKDKEAKTTLAVEAAWPGLGGNTYKVEVVIPKGEEFEIKVLNSESELLETTGVLKTQAEALTYFAGHTTYVKVAKGETTNPPVKLEAKALTGGENGSAAKDETFIKALASFPKALGPGQVALPARYKAEVHAGLAEHAAKYNRFALCDIEDSSTPASLIASKAGVPSGVAGYALFTASSVIVQGLTTGTTRTVAGSSVVAALCAKVARTEVDNQAPAGRSWPLEPYVLGFTNTFTATNMETLNNAGINCWAEPAGIACLFGFVSALSSTVDRVFWQASAGRERMHLVAAAEEIAEKYEFKTIDGRKRQLSKFQGELQGLIAKEWEVNALFGLTPEEAGKAIVAEPVNTLATIQEGQLNAELKVRISPFAQSVGIVIITAPVTEVI